MYGQLLKEDSESRIANANMKLIEEKMKYEAAKEEKEKESSDEAKKKTKKGKTVRICSGSHWYYVISVAFC